MHELIGEYTCLSRLLCTKCLMVILRHSLLAAKSATFAQIGSATQVVFDILHETKVHKSFCQTFGITQEELESTPESAATTAYGGYIIDTGLQGVSSIC
jgi:hydroxymethylpyrimidine/phosphomethylpyrimidine kinase